MSGRPLVLLVDPDADSRTIFRAYFEHRDYGVIDAAEGQSAIDLARRFRPDLVIGELPIDVPGHSPLSEALRDAVGRHLPILVVTSWAATRAEMDAAKAVGDSVLAKPAAPSAVFEAAEHLLNRLVPAARPS